MVFLLSPFLFPWLSPSRPSQSMPCCQDRPCLRSPRLSPCLLPFFRTLLWDAVPALSQLGLSSFLVSPSALVLELNAFLSDVAPAFWQRAFALVPYSYPPCSISSCAPPRRPSCSCSGLPSSLPSSTPCGLVSASCFPFFHPCPPSSLPRCGMLRSPSLFVYLCVSLLVFILVSLLPCLSVRCCVRFSTVNWSRSCLSSCPPPPCFLSELLGT